MDNKSKTVETVVDLLCIALGGIATALLVTSVKPGAKVASMMDKPALPEGAPSGDTPAS